ncbi:DUF6207 family protein [Streptomyces sp. NBC_01591]|uniref:DUF6207 family protein n=1 Tax=Streptomyces sp. NBC_01591 TaxID=2975888 RepID=UPI002DDA4F25|nr:DUF6207 family protein [Streptomyces sp. NBC_01591]WSD66438.1 DUF6207 family protein [Streptomyces sp. NBC_01591]
MTADQAGLGRTWRVTLVGTDMEPIHEQHLREPGLVVFDITTADDGIAHAVMSVPDQLWATSGTDMCVRGQVIPESRRGCSHSSATPPDEPARAETGLQEFRILECLHLIVPVGVFVSGVCQYPQHADDKETSAGALTPDLEHVYAARVRVVDVVWKVFS